MASLHTITNFTGGLISNSAWSRMRNDSASRWSNLRVSSQGYLEPRKGNVLASDELDVDQVFVYKSVDSGACRRHTQVGDDSAHETMR